jgi:hypothetical protein
LAALPHTRIVLFIPEPRVIDRILDHLRATSHTPSPVRSTETLEVRRKHLLGLNRLSLTPTITARG